MAKDQTIADIESGGYLTVKKCSSKKRYRGDGGWEHEEIVLLPLNPNHEAIVISDPEEGRFMVVGELVGVVV
jgi:SOS-response transcriptional repressor LexA